MASNRLIHSIHKANAKNVCHFDFFITKRVVGAPAKRFLIVYCLVIILINSNLLWFIRIVKRGGKEKEQKEKERRRAREWKALAVNKNGRVNLGLGNKSDKRYKWER